MAKRRNRTPVLTRKSNIAGQHQKLIKNKVKRTKPKKGR